MSYKNKATIIDRFNRAVEHLDKAIRFDNGILSASQDAKDAGNAMTEAFEWGLKYYLSSKNTTQLTIKGKIIDLDMVGLCKELTDKFFQLSDQRADSFLWQSKEEVRNISTHKGENLNIEDQKSYISILKKFILEHIDSNAYLKNLEDFVRPNFSLWEKFNDDCGSFDPYDNTYVLVIGRLESPSEYLKALTQLNWNLIIDLDYFSKKDGFWKKTFADLEIQPHEINIGQKITEETFSERGYYHYFMRGFENSGVDENISFRLWERTYSNHIISFFRLFFSTFSNPTKVVFIPDLLPNKDILAEICSQINKMCDSVQFICLDPLNQLDNIVSRYDPINYALNLHDIATGIANQNPKNKEKFTSSNNYIFPYLKDIKTSGVDGHLSLEEYEKISEDFEVLHSDIGKVQEENESRKSFLLGQKALSWWGMSQRPSYDVIYPKTKNYVNHIRERLKDRGKSVIELLHDPGAGGTSLARRIALDLHDEFPVLILKNYRENRALKYIRMLFDKTKYPPLIIVECPKAIGRDDTRTLIRDLKSDGFSFVVLVVGRQDDNPIVPNSEKIGPLTNWGNDCFKLIDEYKIILKEENVATSVVLEREKNLQSIYEGEEDDKKTPFYLGLIALEDSFKGAIESYIKSFFTDITDFQRKVAIYLSIVDTYYGDKGLSDNFFVRLAGQSDNSFATQKLKKFLPKSWIPSLLIRTQDAKSTYWKIRHPLFTKHMISYFFTSEEEGDFRLKLAKNCVEFITDCSTYQTIPTEIDIMLQEMFIGNNETRGGTKFTKLVGDIPEESKENLFVTLHESFPENAHYCSHLARYYAYDRKNKNTDKALLYSERAISLSEQQGKEDAILYHIKGMCFRSKLNEKIEYLKSQFKYGYSPSEEDFDEIFDSLLPKASQDFRRCREIAMKYNSPDEHGYVANIQMLIEVLDFGKAIRKKNSVLDFTINGIEPYSTFLDEAESLLEKLKQKPEDELSEKAQDCENGILELKGKLENVLQNLRNQYDKKKDPKVARQIARIQFGGTNDKIEQYDAILKLMEQNIDLEPNNESNFYWWFNAARRSSLRLFEAAEKIADWNTKSKSIYSSYYLYIFKVCRVLDNYSMDMPDAQKYIRECKIRATNTSDKKVIYEWLGTKDNLKQIVSRRDYLEQKEDLKLVQGIFKAIKHDGDGTILLEGKLEVFFEPFKAGFDEEDLNKDVEFYLGFSYEGLRADGYDVRIAGKQPRKIRSKYITSEVKNDEIEAKEKNTSAIGKLPVPKTNIESVTSIQTESKYKQEIKKQINQHTSVQEKTYKGKIKIKKLSDGYIKCSELDKDIAFGRIQLKDCDMIDLDINTEVEVKIKWQDGKLQTNTNGNNYKASEVRLLKKQF